MEIFKRTFKAKNFPKGSDERNEMNKSTITSEYMPSYKYVLIGEHTISSYRSKKEKQKKPKWLWRHDYDRSR